MLTKTERESIIQELRGYNGNPNLLLAGEKYQYTKWEIEEILKCKNDIHYFIENYVKIVHVDRGLIPFIPWDFQNKTIDIIKDNRFVICKFPRQSGKSSLVIAYILWYVLFSPNVKVAILAHRLKTARELFAKVRLSYEHLPKFLQAGIAPGGWNKGSIILGNGSGVYADATSGGSIRGESFNCISGDGIIQVDIDGKIIDVSLKDFYDITSSSKNINMNDKEIIWDEVDERIFEQQIYKMVKDQKNSRKTSWYETFGGNKTKNVGCPKREDSLEQRIKIKTIIGWETFKGIKKTTNQKTITLLFDNNERLTCTKDHLIKTVNGWKKAQDITNEDYVITANGNIHIQKIIEDKLQDVYDILHTSDTNSFLVNNISVHNCILLDEFAFVENNLAKEFMESVYPTISSGKTTKIITVSTPKGLNHFYEMWEAAESGKSEFVPVEVRWNEIPGRDEEWKKKQIANIGLQSWMQEFECAFLGSSTTLLSVDAMERMIANQKDPIQVVDNMNIYKEPKSGHQYALCVDVSRGQGLDYHAFSVVDVTNLPYEQVLTFRDNTMSPTILPTIIKTVSERYNYAHILVEISDIGGQVADMLVGDIDAENVIRIRAVPGKGQFIGFGVGGKVYNGLKTSPATKRIGCADLKTLIENNMLIVNDKETIREFTTFVADSNSFSADEGKHDDLVMSLVLFGWLAHQRYFRQEAQDIRAHLEEENAKYMESQMVPFGIIDDGTSTFYQEY